MNEKFFDLKKEKQDRMINAGLRIFSLNGYRHASTDEIVKEARISKGLLFHYFGSKAGYYAFLFNYTSRFVILELKSEIRNPSIDYFLLQRRILDTETGLMERYPFVFLFFESVRLEEDAEALSAIEDLDISVNDVYEDFEDKSYHDAYPRLSDTVKLSKILHYVKVGLMREMLTDPSNQISAYALRARTFLEELKTLATD